MLAYETQEARTKFASMMKFAEGKRHLLSLINKFKRTEDKYEQKNTDTEEATGQTSQKEG